MSNDIINIRFGSWHFKWARGEYHSTFIYNDYHTQERKKDPQWKWFEIYKFFWYSTP